MTELKKWFNPIQWSFYLVQRCLDSVQWCKRVASVQVRQLIVIENYTLFGVTFMSYLEMAVRWIDTKQGTITQRVQTFVASGLPVMSLPCPAMAVLAAIEPSQSLPTVGTKPFLSLPSVFYSNLRKSSHGNTSSVGSWSRMDIDDEVWKIVNGKRINLIIFKIPPRTKRGKTKYSIYFNDKYIGLASTLADAKRKGDALLQKAKHV